MGTPDNVSMGPGTIYVAPIGTTEPTDNTTALPSAWRAIGYTEEGSVFTFDTSVEDIDVAEEFYPVATKVTAVSASVSFAMAEPTQQNLALALNTGAAGGAGASFEPPAPGTEVRVMFAVDKENGARWVFRKCFQAGSIEIANRKAPDKTLLAVEFRLEKPTGVQPWKVFKSTTPVAGLV